LTQLGLLPLVDPGVPLAFFESRGYHASGVETISELTAHWLHHRFGPDDGPLAPGVALAPADVAWANTVVAPLEQHRGAIVGVNLGVGGNPRKRVDGAFELNLLRALLAAGRTVILDYGAPDEADDVERLLAALEAEGHAAADLADVCARAATDSVPRLVTYRGGLGRFAALLARTDCYIGYDSAFQHIAAALGVPVVDIFVNPPNRLFSRRWRPSSSPAVRAIELPPSLGAADALALVLDAHSVLLA
jgi:ADP-heptose:LPS heptosyltransferase